MKHLRPSAVTLDLKFLQVTWDTSDSEKKILRKFLNELRTRRAFESSRGAALEMPVHFLASVTEFRSRLRDFANDLPARSLHARVVLLSAIDLAGSILDAWHLAQNEIAPNTWEFSRLGPHQMSEVMESAWPVVETVRELLAKLASGVEAQLE